MTPARGPSNPDLLAVARDLGWPAVTLGALEIAGEAGWRQALARYPPATPGECARLLTELGPYMLEATEGARARLAAWRASGRKVQESPEELRQRIRACVAYYGDVEMLTSVLDAFASVPPAVRDVLLADVAICGTGWATRGWCAPPIGTGPAGQRHTRLILLAGASRDAGQVEHTTRHELGHAWLTPMPGPYSQAVTAHGEAVGLAMAHEEGWACLPRAEAAHAREERLAEACAVLWGMVS